jgi:hypothetical protein
VLEAALRQIHPYRLFMKYQGEFEQAGFLSLFIDFSRLWVLCQEICAPSPALSQPELLGVCFWRDFHEGG